MRTVASVPMNSRQFQDEIIQNYLDLIEFANGAPKESRWAALRAEMGHPEPFGLEMIGVGNENFGHSYKRRFLRIAEAIHARYPEMRLVFTGGVVPYQFILRPMNRFANKYNPAGFIDEHSYHSPEWLIRQADRYDNYKRGGTSIYVGEYAANNELAMAKYDDEKANNYYSALAEAAFLTGLERNGDVVGMSSYAPLFNLVDSTQWTHNLIDFNPAAVSRTANYLVQQLFGGYYGDTYLKTQSVLPDGEAASGFRECAL